MKKEENYLYSELCHWIYEIDNAMKEELNLKDKAKELKNGK